MIHFDLGCRLEDLFQTHHDISMIGPEPGALKTNKNASSPSRTDTLDVADVVARHGGAGFGFFEVSSVKQNENTDSHTGIIYRTHGTSSGAKVRKFFVQKGA